MAKIDWQAARLEYINTPLLSLRALAVKYKVSDDAVFEHSTNEGWLNQRITKQAKIQQKLSDQSETDIVKEKTKMMREASFVSSRGLAGIHAHFPRSAREAKELWEAGSN